MIKAVFIESNVHHTHIENVNKVIYKKLFDFSEAFEDITQNIIQTKDPFCT